MVAKSAITARWLPHANFDHEAHQMVECASCHAKANESRETSDVLIPGVQTCRQCHRAGQDAAEARCFECHVYHDWSKEKPVVGQVHGPATGAIVALLRRARRIVRHSEQLAVLHDTAAALLRD